MAIIWTILAVFLLKATIIQCQQYSEEQASRCPEKYGEQTYPHPELCDQFYLCSNGTLTLEQCGNGLLYDGKGAAYHHCNYHWAVNCDKRKADLVAISSPGCDYQFGLFSDGSACSTNYVKCEHGEAYSLPCEPGLAYDDRIKKCNWPDALVDVGCNPAEIIGFNCPEKVDPYSVSAKFEPYPRFALPGDPHRLITCVNGYPRLISCGEDSIVDESSLTCVEQESRYRNRN
ncbi:protein obstructor-E-like isoform X2 [Adelges cooleyi]|uniref:protein obstructor-E-like isoform X2 n=1 Tax=Adelges cooleyi TaxID=133065 RepID=UPI00217F6370|nr:protein obstructor-E-like isoform X2 [Adelges cooleyi]